MGRPWISLLPDVGNNISLSHYIGHYGTLWRSSPADQHPLCKIIINDCCCSCVFCSVLACHMNTASRYISIPGVWCGQDGGKPRAQSASYILPGVRPSSPEPRPQAWYQQPHSRRSSPHPSPQRRSRCLRPAAAPTTPRCNVHSCRRPRVLPPALSQDCISLRHDSIMYVLMHPAFASPGHALCSEWQVPQSRQRIC